jgi:hypothetical protein
LCSSLGVGIFSPKRKPIKILEGHSFTSLTLSLSLRTHSLSHPLTPSISHLAHPPSLVPVFYDLLCTSDFAIRFHAAFSKSVSALCWLTLISEHTIVKDYDLASRFRAPSFIIMSIVAMRFCIAFSHTIS